MTRRLQALGPLSGLLGALLALGVVFGAVGDHVSSQDFGLTQGNDDPVGLAWNGTYFYVPDADRDWYRYTSAGTYASWVGGTVANTTGATYVDPNIYSVARVNGIHAQHETTGNQPSNSSITLHANNDHPSGITYANSLLWVPDSSDDKVYAYNPTTRAHVASSDFNLATANTNAQGITWDGTYFRVVDPTADKVFAYSLGGVYTSAADFNLAEANTGGVGIAWDGTYLRVLDSSDHIYTYEGLPTTFTNYGLQDDADYEALFTSDIEPHGDWQCVESSMGEAFRINNAHLTVHGFCITETGTSGIEVEIHLASTATYADLNTFANVTGRWWFMETGAAAQSDLRMYDDSHADDTTDFEHALAFTEEVGGLDSSDRLGFATMAKAVSDDDCAEASDGTGFDCSRPHLDSLRDVDSALLLFSLSEENKVEFADRPTTPESLSVSRSSNYGTATITWELFDAVTEYEIERLTAVQVEVADASRIEYGAPVTFSVEGTQAGIDEYEDTTVAAHRTYQYRIRARGASSTSWSRWSEYVFSGARPDIDLAAPGNLELSRDSDSIMVSWTAPVGDFDNYTLQRRELIVAEGSTLFANDIRISGDATMFDDTRVIPGRIYEYRVAAVKDDQVGVYSDWFRIGPLNTSLGTAPTNIRNLFETDEDSQRVYDDRLEFWVDWDDMGGVDDYEVQVASYNATGGGSLSTYVVTDSLFFHTVYEGTYIRTRARRFDAKLCAADPCFSEWTQWLFVRFSPVTEIEAPELVDDTADPDVMNFRADLESALEAALEPAGASVDGGRVVEFLVLLGALLVASVSVFLSWRRGMVPLGVGMAVAIFILVLFVGYRLAGTPVAWPIGAQLMVAAVGMFALVRQFGVFR